MEDGCLEIVVTLLGREKRSFHFLSRNCTANCRIVLSNFLWNSELLDMSPEVKFN